MLYRRHSRTWPGAIAGIVLAIVYLAAGAAAQVPYRIEIGHAEAVDRGTEITIPVTKAAGSEPMTGFDFLISYDYSALTLLDLEPGVIFDPVGDFRWESFEYQQETFISAVLDSTYPPRGNRAMRITATADIENGGLHPLDYHVPDGTVLFSLHFKVTAHIGYACNLLPILFVWNNCSDNAIGYGGIDTPSTALSDHVYYTTQDGTYDMTDPNHFPGYLSYYGTYNLCFDSTVNGDESPEALIDFYDGYVDIVCDSLNPGKGDIDLDGTPYEIGDYEIFTDYFIERNEAFDLIADSQISATDINGDMEPLTIQDFAYLARIVSGDMEPDQEITHWYYYGYPAFTETDTSITLRISTNFPTGAMYLWCYAPYVTSAEVTLLPDAQHMDLRYELINDSLWILIYNDLSAGGAIDSVPSGYADILKISYTGAKPRVMTIVAAGPGGEKINYPDLFGIDERGDINLNGISNEIADYVVYANYFLMGVAAFTVNPGSQIAASEVNGDGLALTVNDLVYLIRIIEGILFPVGFVGPYVGEDITGALDIVQTDSSLILRTEFADSIDAMHLCFHTPDWQTDADYSVRFLGGVDSADFGHNVHDDSLKILMVHSPLDSQAVIAPGLRDICEIVFDGASPEFVYAHASGFLGETVDLVVSSLPNSPPAFADWPAVLYNEDNGNFEYDFNGVDTDIIPDRLSYEIISGPGQVDSETGEYYYQPICRDSGETFLLELCVSDRHHPCPTGDPGQMAEVELVIQYPAPPPGDINGTGQIELNDVVGIIDYLYYPGSPSTAGPEVYDVDADGIVNLLDITYLLAYLFMNGPPPVCP